jgi:hypothetical protein
MRRWGADMEPGAFPGHRHGDAPADRAGAPHGLAKKVTRGIRSAAITTMALALLVGCSWKSTGGPSSVPPVGIIYSPPFIPIAITFALDGSIEVSFSPSWVTPIGTFSLSVPDASFTIPSGDTLLVIYFLAALLTDAPAQGGQDGSHVVLARYDAGNSGGAPGVARVMMKEVIEIKSSDKMRFLVNGGGTPNLTSTGNVAKLTLGSGASGIRIQYDNAIPKIPDRFSVAQVNTLPKPPGIEVPAAPHKSWPVPSITCTTPNLAGTVTCTDSLTSGYTYQWLDRTTPIGTVNPLNNVPLKPGIHLITATATDANGLSFSSSACTVTVAGLGEVAGVGGKPSSSSCAPP